MKNNKLAISLLLIIFFSFTAIAKINFQATSQDRIDLEALTIDKQTFLEFVKTTIINRAPGLGNYGRVAFYPCDMKFGDLKLIEYKSEDGKEIRFFSNPSCHQIVLRKVLEESYRFNAQQLTNYQNRQCILSVEKIISPLLEYYTIKYEESKIAECPSCGFKEKERLSLIMNTQEKILQRCQNESDKVMELITDLDAIIEASFKAKGK